MVSAATSSAPVGAARDDAVVAADGGGGGDLVCRQDAAQGKVVREVPEERGRAELADTLRFSGHVTDVLSLALMASPLVWEHHYVLAIPLIILAALTQHRARPWLVAVGAMLILLPPTFDVFPFAYHRLVGLLMLLAPTSPEIDLERHAANVRDFGTAPI